MIRPNYGTSPAFSCAKITNTEWAPQPNVVHPTPNISLAETKYRVFRWASTLPLFLNSGSHHAATLLPQVNGMDIIAARHGVQYARKWVTEGNGPMLMEFVTYRYGGHSSVSFAILSREEPFAHLCVNAECLILEPRTEPARKSKECEAPRTLSAVCSATSKNGALPPNKNSRSVFPRLLSPYN
jgi:hypothetical protein